MHLPRSFLSTRIVTSLLFVHDQTVNLRLTTRGCDTPAYYPRVKITGAWNVRWIRAGARVGFTCVACDSAPRHPRPFVRILSSRSSVFLERHKLLRLFLTFLQWLRLSEFTCHHTRSNLTNTNLKNRTPKLNHAAASSYATVKYFNFLSSDVKSFSSLSSFRFAANLSSLFFIKSYFL